jgi:hypothetical protein
MDDDRNHVPADASAENTRADLASLLGHPDSIPRLTTTPLPAESVLATLGPPPFRSGELRILGLLATVYEHVSTLARSQLAHDNPPSQG